MKKKKQKESEREAQKDNALEMKRATKNRLTQPKITDILRKVPYMEKSKVLEDEQRKRRFQLKEMNENLWKWRGEKQQKRAEEETEEQKLSSIEDKLKELEDILEQTRREKEDRQKRAHEKSDIVKKKKEDKKMKKIMKNRLEDSWGTMFWVTDLLEENEDVWKREEEDEREREMGRLEEWGKMSRTARMEEMKKQYRLTCLSPSARTTRLKKRRILPAWM